MSEGWNSVTSKRTAQTILKALLAPEDVRKLDFVQAVVLCGLPGSGKSTIARLLHACYGFERFSTDQVRTEELFSDQHHRKGGDEAFQARVMMGRFLVYEELGRRVGRALAQGWRVVVDGTNLEDKRMGIVGSILSQIPVERVAFIMVRPPEWIMKRRFEYEGDEAMKDWWNIYKYWRNYLKEGKAAFPTPKTFPRIQQIHVRRYSIRTFDWVPDIKAIFWDVDGTLYKRIPALYTQMEDFLVSSVQKKLGVSNEEAKKRFWKRYQDLHSKTLALDSFGLDGKAVFTKGAQTTEYERYMKKDEKLLRLIKNIKQIKHMVITNADEISTKRKLKALGLPTKIFNTIYCTYSLPYVKPQQKLFTHILKETGYAPHQCLYVGDVEETDILPAKAAGMRTAYVWGVSKEADVSFKEVHEVAELFGVEV